MRVLVLCEFSGVVRDAFLRQWHDAWSLDIMPDDQNSNRHYQTTLEDAVKHGLFTRQHWDLIIAHPPCTYLTTAGASRWPGAMGRSKRFPEQENALSFVYDIAELPCARIAIENPVGVLSTRWGKPDQIVSPHYWGDTLRKRTCLWLKNLPLLTWSPETVNDKALSNTNCSNDPYYLSWFRKGYDRGRARSVTQPLFASAMAEQWGRLL